MVERIFCYGNSKDLPEIAMSYGWTYGAQMPSTVYYKPEFIDQNWKNPKRDVYMGRLEQHKPRKATVLDLEYEDQFDEVMSWALEASQYVTESVIIIPKVQAVIDSIPESINGKRVILGYSVPTSYGGTLLDISNFRGFPVHLLGGSPRDQVRLLRENKNIVSIDNNYIAGIAKRFKKYFTKDKLVYLKNSYRDKYESPMESITFKKEVNACFTLSLINFNNYINGSEYTIRYGSNKDIISIKKIASSYSKQLGWVREPALLESVERETLFIATYGNEICGFVNFRRRKDNKSTIYEIAVKKEYQRTGVGTALLSSVPYPIKVTTTVENIIARQFYLKNGFTLVETKQGRIRDLAVYEKRD